MRDQQWRCVPLAVLAAVLVWAVGSGGAGAAVINWQTGPTYNGANGFQAIDTTGSLVQAVNMGNAPGPLVVDPGGLNISFTPDNTLLNQGPFNSGSPGTSDVNWNAIIDLTDWNGANVTVSNLVNGLVPGRDYQVQFFASDARGCCSTRTQFFTDGQGNNSPTITQGTFTSVIGTFTADGTTQAIGLNASSNNPILNAFVVRDLSPAAAAPADIVGNPLVNATLQDGAVGSIFVNSESFVQQDGQAGVWGFFDNQAPGRELTPLLLTKAGAQWEIVGVGTTRVSDGSGAQNHPFDVVAGSDATGPGVFLGWKDGGQGTNNAGVAEYDNGGRGWVEWFGPTHTAVNVGDTKSTSLFLNRTYSLNAASTGGVPGESVGNPLGNRGTVDGAAGSIFVLDDPFTIEESTAHVTQWALFTDQTAGTQITPLIMAPNGADWEIVGIGTTRTVTNDGVQVFDFDLVDGSDAATAGLYFGWKDGGQGVNNTGVAEWTNAGPGHVYWLGPSHTNFGVGDVNSVALSLDRTYSFQVFTAAPPPIPEPATAVLLALAGTALLRRRRA